MDPHASLSLLHDLSANAAVCLAALGILLVFFELNRPGRIWVGSFGLLLFLLATAALLGMPLRFLAVLTLSFASAAFLVNLYHRIPFPLLVLATLACIGGLRWLVAPGAYSPVSFPIALGAGTILGAASAVLTRIAYRARHAKALD